MNYIIKWFQISKLNKWIDNKVQMYL
jgi:hypothetical protein